MREFCHNIEPYMQPKPSKNPGGDCFACSLTAILQHLYPENKPSFDTVWNYFMQSNYYMSEKKCLSNTWSGMQKAINESHEDGYNLENTTDLVIPKIKDYSSNIFYESYVDLDYTRRLEGWLRSGWIALTEIHYSGGGPRATWDSRFNDNDHFIILDGTREVWEKIDDISVNARRLNFYIHVVCSAKGSYWISTKELMKNYGAAGWILVRKSDNDR